MPPGEKRGSALAMLLLLYATLYLVVGSYVQLSRWSLPPDTNAAWLEARAWLSGRVDLAASDTLSDIAWVGGRAYNPFPPLLTLICAAGLALQRWLGQPEAMLYPPWYVAVVALPLPLLAFGAMRKSLAAAREQVTPAAPSTPTHVDAWAALLAFALVAGTALQPILVTCRDGHLCSIHHALAVSGLLMIAGDLLGKRRIWPAMIGLAIAAWSRQMTLLYVLPIVWITFQSRERKRPAPCAPEHNEPVACAPGSENEERGFQIPPSARPGSRPSVVMAGLLAIVAPLLVLNHLKFGNPLDFGYLYIYERRDDAIARQARQYGMFTTAMLCENARCMNIAVPPWEWSAAGPRPTFDNRGTSMWFTTPLLLLVLWDIRRWWRDLPRRALMLGTLPVIAGILLYHTTGAGQSGYYRYALDFIPIWLCVIAPGAAARPRFTIACVAWSALYFTLIA